MGNYRTTDYMIGYAAAVFFLARWEYPLDAGRANEVPARQIAYEAITAGKALRA